MLVTMEEIQNSITMINQIKHSYVRDQHTKTLSLLYRKGVSEIVPTPTRSWYRPLTEHFLGLEKTVQLKNRSTFYLLQNCENLFISEVFYFHYVVKSIQFKTFWIQLKSVQLRTGRSAQGHSVRGPAVYTKSIPSSSKLNYQN